MKKAKQILSVLLAVAMLVCAVPMMNVLAWNGGGIRNNGLGGIYIDIYKHPYTDSRWSNYGDPYGPNGCTWFVGARVMELTGKGSYNTQVGSTWYNSYGPNLGFTSDQNPSGGSVICWSGHVAILEKIEGSTAYISEGGITTYPNNDYCNLSTCDVSSIPGRNSGFIGYVHFLSSENIGNDFYANIVKTDGWATVGVVGTNVQIVPPQGDASEYWHFVRNTDGSYIIYNCSNNLVLDVWGAGTANGANVCVHSDNGGTNQRWRITGRWSGEYYLCPLNSDKVLDVNNNDNTVGTNVQIWEKNSSTAQQFAIYKQEKAGPSVLSVSVSYNSVTFSWTKGANCDHYRIRIDNKTTGDTIDFWNLKDLSKTAELPAGSYSAYIDSCNAFSYLKSNEVNFVVSSHLHTWNNGTVTAPATCISTGVKSYSCACGATKTETIPVNSSNHINTKTVAATASTCKVKGYSAGIYCNDCKKYIIGHAEQPLSAHQTTVINTREATYDADGYTGDTYCTVCKQTLSYGSSIPKLTKPNEPTNPAQPETQQPTQQQQQTGGCKWCGQTHGGLFGFIVIFFHGILALLFGAKY